VASDYASGILKEAFETGQLAKLCRRIQISAGSNRIELNGVDETSRVDGSRWGGIRAYWQDEASEKTKSKPTFRKIKLKLNKLIGLCYATDELLDDATALEGVIRKGFAEEFGFKLDDAIINGIGTAMPLGILNAGCLITQDKESGQSANTIVYANILNMWSRMPARSRRTAVWLINQDVEPQLAQMSVDGSGNSPVYLPPRGATEQPYSTIFGRPVIPIEQCQSLGTSGDIYLCDFSNYILAEKGGIQADMSIHVRFIYDESVFRFVLRVDGQPVLSSAITPFKGSNTLSHFINLQTRS
jgi:HK97 family phage major capsid protein